MLRRITSGIALALVVLEVSILIFNVRPASSDVPIVDLNSDGVVDLGDLVIVAQAFHSYPGHPKWNALADVDGDNKVGLGDVCTIVKYFGKTTTTVVKICIFPRTLNLRSRGRWITAYIELPEGYSSRDVNVSTIMLNGTIPAEMRPIAREKCNYDEIPIIMVKFERQKLIDLILRNYEFTDKFGVVTLTITGKLKAGTFQGSTSIKVIMPKHNPLLP